jgi:hypothetical protein
LGDCRDAGALFACLEFGTRSIERAWPKVRRKFAELRLAELGRKFAESSPNFAWRSLAELLSAENC